MISKGIGVPEPPQGWMYLEAVILIKCLDDDGDIRYKETRSSGLTAVEALGMTETYTDTLRQSLLRRANG